jgi:hypothetical protein
MTKPISRRGVVELIGEARDIAIADTKAADPSFWQRGLASEGFAGGYAEALRDMDAVLRHGHPTDRLRIWSRARLRVSDRKKARAEAIKAAPGKGVL